MSTATLHEEVDAYLGHGRAAGWSASTIANYRHLLGIAADFLSRRGCRRAADVAPDDLDALMRRVRDEGRAKKSRVQLAVLLKTFFGRLQERGRVLADPARGLPLPDDGEEDLPEAPLSEDEVAALFASLPRTTVYDLRNRCLLELLYGCALRISEAVALDMDDLDPIRRTLHVRDSKHGQDRLVPVMKTALAATKDYRAVRRELLRGPDHGAFFLTQHGRRWKRGSIYTYLNKLNEARGPDARRLHPHLLRHSVAVHLLRGGADVRHVQQLLGHANLDTTKIYLRMIPGHLREDYDKAMPEMDVSLD